MVSVALPGSYRLTIAKDYSPRPPHDSSAEHTHANDEDRTAVVWLCYFDDEDRIARAVAPEFSFVVERPTVAEASAEVERLVLDAIDDAQRGGLEREGVAAFLPSEIQIEHITRLSKMLELHPDERGTAWLVGHSHMTREKVPAQAT